MFSLGVDIGGTFTDFCLVDLSTGDEHIAKVPTNHADLAQPILATVRSMLDTHGGPGARLASLSHGSTIATNAVLEGTGARQGLLCTRGFGDVLELRRVRLPAPMQFFASRPASLVPRRLVREIDERCHPHMARVTGFDDGQVLAAVSELVEAGIEGLVISFLHAYADPSSEQRARRLVRDRWPNLPVQCSGELLPQIGEYERTMASVLNGYVEAPVVAYVRNLVSGAEAGGLTGRLYITKSNGGCTTADDAMRRPVDMLLSGPASGVVGAAHVAGRAGIDDALTLDMGGTSTEIAVILGGRALTSRNSQVGDWPVVVPAVEVVSIGAGGSSLVHVSDSGLLRIGPQSAGSEPGPACYGRGGTAPTVTDALLVAGVLNPSRFAGGSMTVEPHLAEAVMDRLGDRLGLAGPAAADAVCQVATAQMLVGVRSVLGRLGVDAGRLTLIAFGGAGPVFAALLAEEVGLGRVLVPTHPGTLCALGALQADLRGDFVRTVHRGARSLADAQLAGVVAALLDEARAWCGRVELAPADAQFRISCSMRYAGQGWTLDVPVVLDDGGMADRVSDLVSRFHATHERTYHHADPLAAVEFVDAHCVVAGPKDGARPPRRRVAPVSPGRSAERRVFMGGAEHLATIVPRESLAVGARVDGVAVIEQEDTTTFVPPRWVATVAPTGDLILERGDGLDRR